MNWITALGLIAASMTTIAFMPQAIKTIKTKHTKDLSFGTYLIMTIGVFLWFIYGVLIEDMPLIIANAVTFTITSTILILKIKYK